MALAAFTILFEIRLARTSSPMIIIEVVRRIDHFPCENKERNKRGRRLELVYNLYFIIHFDLCLMNQTVLLKNRNNCDCLIYINS